MIVRVTQPEVFGQPLAREFFIEAVKANEGLNPAALDDLAHMVTQPELGCFVSLDDNGPQAMLVILLPQSAFMECPQIMMIYGRRREATKEVIDAALKFGHDAGYTKAWALNRSGASDEAVQKLFGYVGFARPIATLMEYET